MASVLQHQIESRMNDLYHKMTVHAQIIMRISMEFDKIKKEHADMKETLGEFLLKNSDFSKEELERVGVESNESTGPVRRGDVSTK